tara:strand:- start:1094 stop:1498 length:405 start_codon:yes stop_codon:yes gene_type:complete
MNEHGFIKKIHKMLPPRLYKWKINDPYHGGIPDAYYAGPHGFCFVEYKYIAELPKRGTTKLNFGLTTQQKIWLLTQHRFRVPVYVVLGAEDQVMFTQDFENANAFTVDQFLEHSVAVEDYVLKLVNICLGEQNE